jgi:hypothetical protein
MVDELRAAFPETDWEEADGVITGRFPFAVVGVRPSTDEVFVQSMGQEYWKPYTGDIIVDVHDALSEVFEMFQDHAKALAMIKRQLKVRVDESLQGGLLGAAKRALPEFGWVERDGAVVGALRGLLVIIRPGANIVFFSLDVGGGPSGLAWDKTAEFSWDWKKDPKGLRDLTLGALVEAGKHAVRDMRRARRLDEESTALCEVLLKGRAR